MALDAYLAQYDSGPAPFYAAACRWEAQRGPLVPGAALQLLRSSVGVDIALRFRAGADASVLLLLTADRPNPLYGLVQALRSSHFTGALTIPESAAQFDELTRLPSPQPQLRVNHDGYRSGGHPLACAFRLYPGWFAQDTGGGVEYHLALRPLVKNSERVRRARKYLAWLDLEQPFTEPVRAMQQLLAQRLLHGGWLADEYLLFQTSTMREECEERLRTHFAGSSGLIGFRDAPIEEGEYEDWLVTGCHTARTPGVPDSVPIQAAVTFSDDEIAWLARQVLADRSGGGSETAPQLFISYSSVDFATADATRQFLESEGWPCWMAPRDINSSGLPYTEAIPHAIGQVHAMVVILSTSANLSVHIPRELDLALARKLPFVPIRLEPVQPAGQLDYLLRTCQWLDAFGRAFEDTMGELRTRLRMLERLQR